jgi:hypothetical protein
LALSDSPFLKSPNSAWK